LWENGAKRYLGEFIGTFFLVLVGRGAVFGAIYLGICKDSLPVMLLWAAAVAIVVYVGAAISGADFNPAVTLTVAVWAEFPWEKVIPHIASQLAGPFVAACTLWAMFTGFAAPFEAANKLGRGQFGSQLSGMVLFRSVPNPAAVGFTPEAYAKVPLYIGFLSEFLGTAMLLIMILVLIEHRNSFAPNQNMFPVMLGVAVFAIVALTAPLSMTSLNPARDLGPRILAYFRGWGKIAFPGGRGDF
jgi:glycerol uptake facilitator protein